MDPDLQQKADIGRRHIEHFRAPAAVRNDLTELVTRAGSLVWSRPGLTPAQRSLTTIAVLVARGELGPLREHLDIGLATVSPRPRSPKQSSSARSMRAFPP